MKKSISVSLMILISFAIFGQAKVIPVKELGKYSMSLEKLDNIYKNVIEDTTFSVFSQSQSDTLIQAYNGLLQKMGNFLSKNDLKWETSAKCWNRIYFNAKGGVDYYVYTFLSPVDVKKEETFKRILNSYFTENRLSIDAPVKFSLCSRVTWKD